MATERSIRVLHSVDEFLSQSENWIYPVVTGLDGVETRVMCRGVANQNAFDFPSSRVALSPPPWSDAAGIPRLINSLAFRLGWRDAAATVKLLPWRPQLLHAHFGMRGWLALQLKALFRVPLVTSFYGLDAWLVPVRDLAWLDRYQMLFSAGDMFLAEGHAMRERLITLGCPATKVLVQHIGIDIKALQFNPPSFEHGLRVALAGRYVEKKGFADGLRACAMARQQGVDVRVTVIGDAPANDKRGQRIKTELLELASAPELAGCVAFPGFVPREKLHATLRSHNVFLCPSRHASDGDAEGGSPVVLTEAMALGLVCVGTRHCDIPELILDGRTGYLVSEGDCPAMAHALYSIAHNRPGAVTLAQNARLHVKANYSLETQLTRMREHYRELLRCSLS
jgi:colanic acid/amylovoran biosynthesis glycosyltransferase